MSTTVTCPDCKGRVNLRTNECACDGAPRQADAGRERALAALWPLVRDEELTTWTDTIGIIETVLREVGYDRLREFAESLVAEDFRGNRPHYITGARRALGIEP